MISLTKETLTVPGSRSCPKIGALTGVRFLAAMAVVIYHYWKYLLPGTPTITLFENCFAGVSFFYVLSGYILGVVYVSGSSPMIDKPRFWVARFARIYLALAASVLLLIPLNVWDVAHRGRPVARAAIAVVTLGAHIALLQAWSTRLMWLWNTRS